MTTARRHAADRMERWYWRSVRAAMPDLWDEYGGLKTDTHARAVAGELYRRAAYWRARVMGTLPPDDRPRRERPR